LVKALKDKPVKFFAIGAGDNIRDVTSYAQQNQVAMPIFADSLSVMEGRYGMKISLQNIWQFRILGPDGKVAGSTMTKEAIESIVAKTKAEWKYKGKGYETKLDPVLDQLEVGQYAFGLKLLAAYRKDANKKVAESANQLYADLKGEGEGWKKQADELAETEPVQAYDLYSKVAVLFPGSDLAKSAAEPLKTLGKDKAVSKELAARKVYGQLYTTLSTMTPAQKPAAVKFCQDLAKKFPDTPSAAQAEELAKELEK